MKKLFILVLVVSLVLAGCGPVTAEATSKEEPQAEEPQEHKTLRIGEPVTSDEIRRKMGMSEDEYTKWVTELYIGKLEEPEEPEEVIEEEVEEEEGTENEDEAEVAPDTISEAIPELTPSTSAETAIENATVYFEISTKYTKMANETLQKLGDPDITEEELNDLSATYLSQMAVAQKAMEMGKEELAPYPALLNYLGIE